MKTKILPLMAALLGPVIFFQQTAMAEPVKEDLTKVYEMGRTAFNKGDLVAAKVAFAKVLRAKPDFDLAIIYMAQIRHAEAQWEARPRSQKIAEQARVAAVDLQAVTLADALEVVRRELEKAGGGRKGQSIELMTDLPTGMLEQPVTLSVRNVPMSDFVEMTAFAGNVRIAWHPRGLSVTTNAATARDASDPAKTAAVKQMRETAQAQVIPSIHFENASVEEAVRWLQGQADPVRGPLLLLRGPVNPGRVNLNLRNSSIPDALRSLAIVADLEVSWHSWGAGLAPKAALAVTQPAVTN